MVFPIKKRKNIKKGRYSKEPRSLLEGLDTDRIAVIMEDKSVE